MREPKFKSETEMYELPEPLSRFTTSEELRKLPFAHTFSIESDVYPVSGIPLLVDENGTMTILSDDSHTIIYGDTGSKKTRSVIRPATVTSIMAGDSIIITDPKGELAIDSTINKMLAQNGYTKIVLDFSNFKSDGYNILEFPFRLYCEGDVDGAMACVMRLVASLSEKYRNANDPFWSNQAETQLASTIHILFETLKDGRWGREMTNILTVLAFIQLSGYPTGEKDSDGGPIALLEKIVAEIAKHTRNTTLQQMQSVLNTPRSRTRPCIEAITCSFLSPFIYQAALANMMSVSTFDIREAYEKPMCVFLIIPDETSAYDSIAGIVIDSMYSQLIDVYSKCFQNEGKKPKRSVNFICDEFCNVRINDMGAKISASRSRNIRWYLVCQSLRQLQSTYDSDAPIIVDNCKNILFLQGSDNSMLSYISEQCGTTTHTDSGRPEPLVTPEELRKLKKTWEYKDALYIRDNICYHAKLMDIDTYGFAKRDLIKNVVKLPDKLSDVSVITYTPVMLQHDIEHGIVPLPFTGKRSTPERSDDTEDDACAKTAKNETPHDMDIVDLQKLLAIAFDKVYGGKIYN